MILKLHLLKNGMIAVLGRFVPVSHTFIPCLHRLFCITIDRKPPKALQLQRYHFHKENVLDLFLNQPHKTQCAEAPWWLPCSIPLEFGGGGRAHMQSTTLLDPWPTSRIWLLRQEHTATPAPALQCDTEPTSSHLREKGKRFLPFLSILEVFSVPEILFQCLAVHSAQKCTPFSAKSDWNKQKNVDCYWMKEW